MGADGARRSWVPSGRVETHRIGVRRPAVRLRVCRRSRRGRNDPTRIRRFHDTTTTTGQQDTFTFLEFFAPAYDFRYLQRWIYLPAQDEMIALLNTSESPMVVADIGCGTGILADRIEHETQATEVYGVDLSTGMLTQARARSAQVNWLTGSAERLPFDDGALDAVVTTTPFQFFDQPAALGEFHRVLAPGGLAAVAALSPPRRLPLRGLVASRVNIGPHHPRADGDADSVRRRRLHYPRTTPRPSAYLDEVLHRCDYRRVEGRDST